ncbi:DUF6069 family protein [Microbacterium rhizomatis]|uniref:Uncharacterized protein n=1 Tax=Microbacterium rhizomatis TaxID=1631477 RepID=A0A5J5IWG5_9MICO|nr:DUF6069 family protein [Microbacterium rhizomatis]KAA9105502.1 hypothetical protein F6B43_17140 [Microbacterium rhizomatis]
MNESIATTGWMPRLWRAFGLDFPMGRRQPAVGRTIVATVVALVGSIAACAVLAWLGPIVFPRTAGYEHYGFADYAKLTTIGVLIACAAWPLVTMVTTRAARLYFWLAVIVTVGSFVPDLWLLVRGDDAEAVLVLAVMHVALAVVTYPAMVLIAPQRSGSTRAA